jgi:4-methyl-5(b-hydroxyethyl)-thiazole monophosphate biosynthesis
MAIVLVPLAEGFEETEAITIIDLLRRAGNEVLTASLTDNLTVTGAHEIAVLADKPLTQVRETDIDAVVLPGGQPGTTHLKQNTRLRDLLINTDREEKWIGAICAAPTVIAAAGLLKDKKATCYPGCETDMDQAITTVQTVEKDGHIITSRGLGTAVSFSLELIRHLNSQEKAQEIGKAVLYGELS